MDILVLVSFNWGLFPLIILAQRQTLKINNKPSDAGIRDNSLFNNP